MKTVVFIRANPGKKETTDGSSSHVRKQRTFPEVVAKSQKVRDQYQVMGLVFSSKTFPLTDLMYNLLSGLQ